MMTLQDITAWKKLERQLRKKAQIDGLTKLQNQRAMVDRLESDLVRAKRYGLELSCMMIDLDYFNGDEAALVLYMGEGPIPKVIKVKSAMVASLRSGPVGPAIGATWRGANWPVLGMNQDKTYYRVEGWIKADKVEEI